VLSYVLWGMKAILKLPWTLVVIKLAHHNVRFTSPRIIIENWPVGSAFRREAPFVGLTLGVVSPRNLYQDVWITNDIQSSESSNHGKFIPVVRSARLALLRSEDKACFDLGERLDSLLRVRELVKCKPPLLNCYVQPRLDGSLWVMDGTHRLLSWAYDPSTSIRFLVTI